jgi:hypothetical protein
MYIIIRTAVQDHVCTIQTLAIFSEEIWTLSDFFFLDELFFHSLVPARAHLSKHEHLR